MSKIALITDTHFGGRNDSPIFAKYFAQFYREVFFPYIDANNIEHVVHLGDIVDRRKYVNYLTANHLKRELINPLIKRKINTTWIIGNHDCHFKNTNKINSMTELNWNKVDLFRIIANSAEEVNFNGVNILMVPWINPENEQQVFEKINATKAEVCFGHFEISGFQMYKGSVIDHGINSKLLDKFDIVCSGHFHHKSTTGNINYLGSPYEITWSDFDDPKGFHVFDVETRELTFIENPFRMFHKVLYDDADQKFEDVVSLDYSLYKDAFVKVIVRNKTNPYWFDNFIERLEKSEVQDIQVVDDHFNLNLEDDSDIIDEAEDTLSLLIKYTNSFEIDPEKQKSLSELLQSLYHEALSLE